MAQQQNVHPRMGESALWYARKQGWVLAPLHHPMAYQIKGERVIGCSCSKGIKCGRDTGKHPMADLVYHGLDEGSSDPDVIANWWRKKPNANIAIITGRKNKEGLDEGSGLVVVDVDVKPGRDGKEQLDHLQQLIGKFPETPTVNTGSGGLHLYFKHPGPDVFLPNRQMVRIQGHGKEHRFDLIQIRGDRGYVVGPPSLHYCGKTYGWELGLRIDEVEMQPLPDNLREALWTGRAPAEMGSVVPEGQWPPIEQRINRARGWLRRQPPGIQGMPNGGGSEPTFYAAQGLVRGFCIPEAEALNMMHELFNPRCVPPWSDKELRHKVQNAAAVGRKPYGFMFANDVERAMAFEAKRLEKLHAEEGLKAKGSRALPPASPPEQELRDGPPESSPPDLRSELGSGSLPPDVAQDDPVAADLRAGGREAFPEQQDEWGLDSIPDAEVPGERQSESRRSGGGGGGNGGGGGGRRGGIGDGESAPFSPYTFAVGDEVELARATIEIMEAPDENGRATRPLIFDEGAFWRYDPDLGYWVLLKDEVIEGQVQRFAHNPRGEDEKPLELSQSKLKGARYNMMLTLLRRPTQWRFDNAPSGILFRNGFLQLHMSPRDRTGTVEFIEDMSPDFMCRHRIEADYTPEDRRAPLLRRFFEVLFYNIQDPTEKLQLEWVLQEFAGACLAGVATTYEKALVICGDGGNGKSQVLQFLEALFPKGSCSHVPPEKWGARFQDVNLVGSRANFCGEIASDELKWTSTVKGIISGDPQQTEPKFGKPMIFTPEAGHIFAANALFETQDHSLGFWDRWIALPLTCRIRGVPGLQIKDIGKQIAQQELGQVAVWAIEGLMRLLHNGFYTQPSATVEAKLDWRNETDVVRRFLLSLPAAYISKLNTTGVAASELYGEYIAWIEAMPGGIHQVRNAMTSTMFGKKANTCGFLERKAGGNNRRYFSNDDFAKELNRMSRQSVELDEYIRMREETRLAKESRKQEVF